MNVGEKMSSLPGLYREHIASTRRQVEDCEKFGLVEAAEEARVALVRLEEEFAQFLVEHPEVQAQESRRAASQENGKKGGRPRKLSREKAREMADVLQARFPDDPEVFGFCAALRCGMVRATKGMSPEEVLQEVGRGR